MRDIPAIDRYGNSATRQMLALSGRLARRIGANVDALIADLANEAGTASAWQHLVHLGGGGTQVYGRNRAGTPELIGGFEGAIPADLTAKLAGAGRRIRLRLGRERAVVKTLSLPEGARDVLAAVIRNKVESLAPWPLEEAIWGYRETAGSQPGHIGIEIGIASRRTVETLLAALARSGITADRLDIAAAALAEDGIAIDVHGAARIERARQWVMRTLAAAAAVAALAGGLGLYLALSAQAELGAVEQRGEALTRALTGGAVGGTGDKLAFANSVYERKKTERPLIAILNTLTSVVPDGIFLNGLDYEDNAVTLTGRGNGASEVIGLLEGSDVFAAAAFSSATQRDPNSNAEIFSISATIEAPGAQP